VSSSLQELLDGFFDVCRQRIKEELKNGRPDICGVSDEAYS